METAVRKGIVREKQRYSLRQCMRLQQIFMKEDILRTDSVAVTFTICIFLFCVFFTRKWMVVCCASFYAGIKLWIERSVLSTRKNLSKIIPVGNKELVKIRFISNITSALPFIAVFILMEFVIQLVAGDFPEGFAGFTEKWYVYWETIYSFFAPVFLGMCIMPVMGMRNRKKAIGYTILTFLIYSLLTMGLLHWVNVSEYETEIIPVNFANDVNEFAGISDFPVRLVIWVGISCVWSVISYLICCRQNPLAVVEDRMEKGYRKRKKKEPKASLMGAANMSLNPGYSFVVMILCAGLLSIAVAGRNNLGWVFLQTLIGTAFLTMGQVAVFFKNRKNILHRLPLNTNGLIKMALKYVGIVLGGLIGGIMIGFGIGLNIFLSVAEIVEESGVTVPGLAGMVCWYFCVFWLAAPYLFAGEKKEHTKVFTTFVLGVVAVTVLMLLPFLENGGNKLLTQLPILLLPALIMFMLGWWSYLKSGPLSKMPKAVKSGIGLIVGTICVYMGIQLFDMDSKFGSIVFATDDTPVNNLLTLAAANNTNAWKMVVIGLLCAVAVVPFSLQQMQRLVSPDQKIRSK